jgi:hypothetical protein
MLGVRGDEYDGGSGPGQNHPPGQRGRPEGQGRRYTAGFGYRERRNRHPAVSNSRLGEGADGAGEPVEGRGCSAVATVHPPTKATKATAAEIRPHQGTERPTARAGGNQMTPPSGSQLLAAFMMPVPSRSCAQDNCREHHAAAAPLTGTMTPSTSGEAAVMSPPLRIPRGPEATVLGRYG